MLHNWEANIYTKQYISEKTGCDILPKLFQLIHTHTHAHTHTHRKGIVKMDEKKKCRK